MNNEDGYSLSGIIKILFCILILSPLGWYFCIALMVVIHKTFFGRRDD